ncbi:MAG: hypothetical protein ABFD16_24990 [Thermoguttaceae bacterium]|jgi:hypothetical protein
MHRTFVWTWSVIVSSVVFIGCGASTQPLPPLEDLLREGIVDTTLPRNLQVKQETLVKVLSAVRDGARPEQIPRVVPGVTFQESKQQFLDGTVRLVRWKFNGRPVGDTVPVVLYFATIDKPRESDQAQRKVERSYRVATLSNRVTIARR